MVVFHPSFLKLCPNSQFYWLAQGRIEAERAVGRSLTPTRYQHCLQTMDSGAVRLPMRPVVSIESIRAQPIINYTPLNPARSNGDWQEVSPSDCHLSPSGLLRLPQVGRYQLEVDYVAGWPLDSQSPSRSTEALLQAIADLGAALVEFDRDGATGLPQTYRIEGEYSWGYNKETKSPSQLRYEGALAAVKAIILNA